LRTRGLSFFPAHPPLDYFGIGDDTPNVMGATVTLTARASGYSLRLILMSTPNPVLSISTDEHKKLEFQLKLVKDEIAAQANTFDQIDSKTGVALGFTFVVVGQVLAAVFRVAIDNNVFHSEVPIVSNTLFAFANLFAILAIGFGVKARWPREFEHSIDFSQDELSLPYLPMLEAALKSFTDRAKANERMIEIKGWWATRTYLFVGLALVTYLTLTLFLYFSNA
jgi:hypothetical protein